jgi:hypothetical protein
MISPSLLIYFLGKRPFHRKFISFLTKAFLDEAVPIHTEHSMPNNQQTPVTNSLKSRTNCHDLLYKKWETPDPPQTPRLFCHPQPTPRHINGRCHHLPRRNLLQMEYFLYEVWQQLETVDPVDAQFLRETRQNQ